MLVLDYLKTHSLQQLRDEHGVRFHIKDHLVTLAYDQFEASMNNPFACMCRGMVITESAFVPSDVAKAISSDRPLPTARIIAFPFVRFFNYGQGNLIFKPHKVYEKLDGSMIVIYFDDRANKWQVATRNVPDGSNTTHTGTMTFRGLALEAAYRQYGLSPEQFFALLSKGTTYIFELMTPENKVVVEHSEYKLVMIGARGPDFQEIEVEIAASKACLESVPFQMMNSKEEPKILLDGLVNFANMRDPLYHEGFVVLGENGQRLKIKSEGYTTYNKVQDLTDYDIINLILIGEIDDYMPLFKDYQKNNAIALSEKVSGWARRLNAELTNLRFSMNGFSTRREFAEYVNGNEYLRFVAKSVFRAYAEKSAILDAQELIKSWLDNDSKRYTDSFLRSFARII